MPTIQRFLSSLRSADEFCERLQARDDTLVSDDPCPYPPNHQFLLNLEDVARGRIRMRHYAGPTKATSPILQIDLEPREDGLAVRCHLLDSAAEFSPQAAAERERLEREERADDNVDLILDTADLEFADVAFNLVARPLRWLFYRTVMLFQFLSQRQGAGKYGNRLFAAARDVARQAPSK